MADATNSVNTPRRPGFEGEIELPIANGIVLYAGEMVGVDSNGRMNKATASVTTLGRFKHPGRGKSLTGNSGGTVRGVAEFGIFKWANLGADLVVAADVGKNCYVSDSQTVEQNAITVAGPVYAVDSDGVWVVHALWGIGTIGATGATGS